MYIEPVTGYHMNSIFVEPFVSCWNPSEWKPMMYIYCTISAMAEWPGSAWSQGITNNGIDIVKNFVRRSYLYKGNPDIGKTTSLYWDGALVPWNDKDMGE